MAKSIARAGPSLLRVVKDEFKEERRVKPLTSQGWLRVSALSSLCAREEVLAAILDIERHDFIDTDLLLTFNHGHGLHWALQNRVLSRIEVLFGRWRCKICGACYGGVDTDVGNIARPKTCTSNICKDRKEPRDGDDNDFEYQEQFFKSNEYRIGGHPDGFLRLPDADEEGVLEGKSVSERRSKEIRDVPDFGHVVQLQTYMWLTGRKWGVILYWVKGLYRSPFIEHYVERDDETIEKIKEMISGIWYGIKKGVLPDRICSSPDCNRAEECSLAEPCFKTTEEL
jgi:hypothetical protein